MKSWGDLFSIFSLIFSVCGELLGILGSIVSPNSETAGRTLNHSKLVTFDNCYVIALASFKTLRLKGRVYCIHTVHIWWLLPQTMPPIVEMITVYLGPKLFYPLRLRLETYTQPWLFDDSGCKSASHQKFSLKLWFITTYHDHCKSSPWPLQVIALVEHVCLLLHFVLPAVSSLMKGVMWNMDPDTYSSVATRVLARLELALRADICPCRGDKKKRRVWWAQFDKGHKSCGFKTMSFLTNLRRTFNLDLDLDSFLFRWVEATSWKDLSVDDKWDEVNWIKRSSQAQSVGRLHMELDFDLLETTPGIPAMFVPIYSYGTQLRLTSLSVVCCSSLHFAFCWILFASQFRLKLWVTCSAAGSEQGIHQVLQSPKEASDG